MIWSYGRAGIALAALLTMLTAHPLRAQTGTSPSAGTQPKQAAMTGYIAADSPPYRIEWTGTGGTFVQHAYAKEPEKHFPLTYLHTQAGPTGYSKHLAWYLARDSDGFNLLWLYLDDSGTDFGCWLYQYPSNRLTYLKFQGKYRFNPPAAIPAANFMDGLSLRHPPRYTGTDFTFRDWTRESGTLPRLELFSPPLEGPIVGTSAPPSPTVKPQTPVRTLTSLQVSPLHQIQVGDANGWRTGGWRELHCLAFDPADDPYYLILYSNETSGFVVDIRRAQTYTVNFGEKVKFSEGVSVSAVVDHNEGQGELRVRRSEPHDFNLRSVQKHVNPYTEVVLTAEFQGPNGKKIFLPGYWENGNSWNIRFAPQLIGDWTWVTRSNDPDLNGQLGSFECIAVDGNEPSFFSIHPERAYRHHFGTTEGKQVLPFALRDPAFLTDSAVVPTPAPTSPDAAAPLPATFTAFQKRLEALSGMGVNRLIGGYLLGNDAAGMARQANEGGTAFLDSSLDRPNPEFFRWMDQRIVACNAHDIVPDIGFGWPSSGMFQKYSDVQLRRFWLYILARYASYDISWNLFGDEAAPLDEETENRIASFAELTHLYDPNHHPLTVMMKGAEYPPLRVPTPPVKAGSRPAADAVAAPPDAAPVPVFPHRPWLDYVTLVGGNANALDYLYSQNRPIVVLARSGLPMKEEKVSLDITRRWMWETRLRGGYWSGNLPVTTPLSNLELKMETDCAKFFRQTRWWRLEPHPEMLTGKEETPAEHRRRRKAEEDNIKAAEEAGMPVPPTSAGETKSLKGPSFLLADPGHEYVVYLEKGGYVTLDLLEATGHIRFTWFNPRTGEFQEQPPVLGGGYSTFIAPDKEDWILYLSRR